MVKEGAKKSGRRAVGGAAKAPAKDKDEGEEEESEKVEEFRFKHLLEPIRDLTVNWNVDIARDLEGYLGELELLEISLDGGDNLLNFAEAALLIQVPEYGHPGSGRELCSARQGEREASGAERGMTPRQQSLHPSVGLLPGAQRWCSCRTDVCYVVRAWVKCEGPPSIL